MRVSLLTQLLIACSIPPLASAWCSGGGRIASGIGLGALSVIRGSCGGGDRLAPPQRRRIRAHGDLICNSIRHPRTLISKIDAFELRSKTNDDDDDDLDVRTDDGVGAAGGGPMTPAKASKLLSTFWSMAYPYYRESKPGRRLFYGMILLTLINSGVSVAFSYVSKDFWNALSSKDAAEFYVMMTKFAAALIVGAPVSVLYRFQREQLAVHWREWMTDRTLQLYNSNRVYYSLERDISGVSSTAGGTIVDDEGGDGEIIPASEHRDGASDLPVVPAASAVTRIDNPDQRITEDVRTFTAFSLQLFITVVTSIIDLVSFSLILYSIQPQLFATIIVYAMFGTFTTVYVGRSLLPLNFDKLRREADLRYLLVRIRENAESIAFYGGEDVEGKEVTSRLSRVVENRRDINVAQRNLEFFTTCYQYLIQVVPVAVVAPQYFAGTIQLGVISQSNGAFNHILSDLTVIVNQFEQLSSFSAGIERLSSFYLAMRDADSSRSGTDGLLALPKETFNDSLDPDNSSLIGGVIPMQGTSTGVIRLNFERMTSSSIANGQNDLLRINKLSLMTPDRKRTLIDNLDLIVHEGENLLIVGNSGSGKSSLLRAIAGLWTSGSGEITRVPDDEVYFLPQRPYCALGSLKDQLLYPSTESLNPDDYPEGHRLSRAHLLRESMTDQRLLDVLEMVDLKELPFRFGDGKDPIKGLNAVLDWGNTLSLGEQQRLAFGRLIVNQPRLVILDEATSALDVASEANMYSLLRNMARKELKRAGSDDQPRLSRPGLTFISVGHRPTLLAYHDVKLRLSGGSEYSLELVEKSVTIPRDMKML